MRASAVNAVRGLVMLGCLVAIPLAALCGTSLRETARALLADYWPQIASSQPEQDEEVPKFEPMPPGETKRKFIEECLMQCGI